MKTSQAVRAGNLIDRSNWLSSVGWMVLVALILATLGIYENIEGFAARKLTLGSGDSSPEKPGYAVTYHGISAAE